MNIKQIEYFVKVAKTLNYTKASQQLYVSQSAVTKQINLLEEELGTKLFIRNNKYVKLTMAGEILLRESLDILCKIENCQNIIKDLKFVEKGNLRLGYVNGLERTFFVSIVHEFYKEHPQYHMSFDSGISYILREKLLNEQVDMILTHRYFDSPDYENLIICKVPIMVFVRKDSPYAKKQYLEKSELLNLDIMYDTQGLYCEHGESIPLDHLLLLILEGKGTALLPEFAIHYTQFQDYLVGIPVKDMEEKIYAIYQKKNSNPLIQEFIKYLKIVK